MRSKSPPVLLAPKSSQELEGRPLLELIDAYLSFYASGSSHTARAKRNDVEKFLSFLCSYRKVRDASLLKIQHWDHSATQHFIDENLAKGEAPATVSRRLATLKHMGRTLAERIAGFINPAREVKGPKVTILRPKSLLPHERQKITSQPEHQDGEKSSFNKKRNLFLLQMLLETGMRADEIRLLKLNQIDETCTWIKNVRTKGRRFRNVYLSSTLRKNLKVYLEERLAVLKKSYGDITIAQSRLHPLFISTYGAKPGQPDTFFMGSKTLWRAIRGLSKDTKLHPHLLRHTFALDLLESSNDIRLVAQALGHSDVRVTMRYTERRDKEVAEAVEKKVRRGKK